MKKEDMKIGEKYWAVYYGTEKLAADKPWTLCGFSSAGEALMESTEGTILPMGLDAIRPLNLGEQTSPKWDPHPTQHTVMLQGHMGTGKSSILKSLSEDLGWGPDNIYRVQPETPAAEPTKAEAPMNEARVREIVREELTPWWLRGASK